tara:strand:- start:1903 stop:2991 length:1089 start_codon:yes stop_codon:yes gene_type:complete
MGLGLQRVTKLGEILNVNTSLVPVTDDGPALGTGSLKFADLFLGSGSVINFNNGDVTLTHSSGILTLGGSSSTISVSGVSNYETLVTDDDDIPNKKYVDDAVVTPVIPTNLIFGLTLSNNGTDATNDVDVAVGGARDDGNAATMQLTSGITMRTDGGTWVVGNNQPKLDTGSRSNNTLYAVWLIQRSDTGVVDVLYSLSFTSPTYPTNYDRKRLIGAIYIKTAAVLGFTQQGDYFRYTGALPLDVNDLSMTDETFETASLSVPPNCLAHVYATSRTETNEIARVVIKPVGADEDPSGFNNTFAGGYWSGGGATNNIIAGNGLILVDSSSQIQYAVEGTSAPGIAVNCGIATIGFIMMTRSNL